MSQYLNKVSNHHWRVRGNLISSLSSVPQCLPMSIVSLSLGENEVSDLCHFCYLSSLPRLEQLTVQKNPCVEFCLDKLDYRLVLVGLGYLLFSNEVCSNYISPAVLKRFFASLDFFVLKNGINRQSPEGINFS